VVQVASSALLVTCTTSCVTELSPARHTLPGTFDVVPPRPVIDAAFVVATTRLAGLGLTTAEIVRALQPLTMAIGSPAPSYSAVRRIAAVARRCPPPPNPYVEELLEKLLTGRVPDFYRVDLQLALQAPSGPVEAFSRVRRGGP
jgi:hypothetical protein